MTRFSINIYDGLIHRLEAKNKKEAVKLFKKNQGIKRMIRGYQIHDIDYLLFIHKHLFGGGAN